MRTCPQCGAKSLGLLATLAAALQSGSQCAACGSEVASPFRGDAIIYASALVGSGAGFAVQSYLVGFLVALGLSALVLLVPLETVDGDHVAFRQKLRESGAAVPPDAPHAGS